MTIQAFLLRIKHSYERPKDVSPWRWRAMLRWHELRLQHKDNLLATFSRGELEGLL